MVPVLNKPFLEYVLLHLKKHDIGRVVLAMSHLTPAIESFFGDGHSFGLVIEYVREESPLGTAGAVRNAAGVISQDSFFVLNGDIFTDLDLGAMFDSHRRRKAVATIALTRVADPTAYGLIEMDETGRVSRFLEKPRLGEITTDLINAGTYIFEPEVLARIPPGVASSFERELFPNLLEAGEPVYGFADSSYWIDIGTPESYARLNKDLLLGKSKQYSPHLGHQAKEKGSIHPKTEVAGPVLIGRGCTIGSGARLIGPSVIGPGCRIAPMVVVEDTILWDGVEMGTGAEVRRSIISCSSRLGDGCLVEDAVLGDNVVIAPGFRLMPGSRIWPGSQLG